MIFSYVCLTVLRTGIKGRKEKEKGKENEAIEKKQINGDSKKTSMIKYKHVVKIPV